VTPAPSSPSSPAPPVWDVDVRRRFGHAGRRFELHAAFASGARRLLVFGPSGAGKSQTLKLIAGVSAPDAGHVRLAGRTLVDRGAGVDLPARDRRLGYVFQDYALFPHLTVAQNLAFGLSRHPFNPGRHALPPEVLRWMKAFELDGLASQYPEQLSGGQRQRVALARALVPGPQALLLDEPFAALDTGLRARLRGELAALQTQLDIPMLLITHDEADVDHHLGDEVLHMREGQMVRSACEEARVRDEAGSGAPFMSPGLRPPP
jgi:molybdate transport system ATP-binding protein